MRLKYSEKGLPLAVVNNGYLVFEPEKLLLELREEIMSGNNKIHSFNLVSRDGFPYHETTPLKYITEDSFCIVINNTDYYMVIKFDEEDIFDNDSHPLDDLNIQRLMASFGSTAGKSTILSNFVNHTIEEILKHKTPNNTINGYALKKIIESKIQKDSLGIKFEMEIIEKLLDVLKEKKEVLLDLKTNVETSYRNRSKRRIKFLYSLVLLQMAFTQYGTYVKYSWDVMEPICCLFGIFDSILAYSFWMANNNDYSLEQFEQQYIDKNLSKYFNKYFDMREQLEDIDKMINHFELWKSLHSESLPEILEALDKKFPNEPETAN